MHDSSNGLVPIFNDGKFTIIILTIESTAMPEKIIVIKSLVGE